MYLEYFGLHDAPFRIAPHTAFFFSGGNRGATLEALLYAITHDQGIVKVTGDIGSGKTLLCRALLERLPPPLLGVFLPNPPLTREEMLAALAEELGLSHLGGRRQLLRGLRERLAALHADGRHVVVLVDEAHAMPTAVLAEIRLLTNLESDHRKLLQIVLFGQPDLDRHLQQPDLRQFKERITHNFTLERLKPHDIASYLGFRLRAAGYRGPDLFSPEALDMMARASGGLALRINILADKALSEALAAQTRLVTRHEMTRAISDAQFAPPAEQPRSLRFALGLAAAGVAATAAAVVATLQIPWSQETVPGPAASPPRHETPPRAPIVAPAALPSPPPTVAPSPAAEAPPPPTAPAATGEDGLGPLTAARLKESTDWLRSAPADRYFIQLMTVDVRHAAVIEDFLAKPDAALDERSLRLYRSNLSGRDRIGVIYGDFASQEKALSALKMLPAPLLEKQPYLRTVDKLR